LWSELQLKIDALFTNIVIKPSLLHGDLWGGNAGQINGTAGKIDCNYLYV